MIAGIEFAHGVGQWKRAHWVKRPHVIMQVRDTNEDVVEVREYERDEFGRWHWSEARGFQRSFWNTAGCEDSMCPYARSKRVHKARGPHSRRGMNPPWLMPLSRLVPFLAGPCVKTGRRFT